MQEMGLAKQSALENSATASLQCTEDSNEVDAPASSLDCQAQDSTANSPAGSGLASRPPTQQEIQQMDDLDLSINLGSLLGPGESWIADDEDQLKSMEAFHSSDVIAGSAGSSKPFQELFP